MFSYEIIPPRIKNSDSATPDADGMRASGLEVRTKQCVPTMIWRGKNLDTEYCFILTAIGLREPFCQQVMLYFDK